MSDANTFDISQFYGNAIADHNEEASNHALRGVAVGVYGAALIITGLIIDAPLGGAFVASGTLVPGIIGAQRWHDYAKHKRIANNLSKKLVEDSGFELV